MHPIKKLSKRYNRLESFFLISFFMLYVIFFIRSHLIRFPPRSDH